MKSSPPDAPGQLSLPSLGHAVGEVIACRNLARTVAGREKDRVRFARRFIAAICCDLVPATPPPVEPLQHALARAISAHVADLELDLASYLIGTIYAAMLPDDVRANLGVFYTPPGVSNRLMSLAADGGVQWNTARVADISCGGGGFLTPVALRILQSRRWRDGREAVSHLKSHLKGFEIDPFSAWMAEVFLNTLVQRKFPRTNVAMAGVVEAGDSLTRPVSDFGCFDLVIGNPPYGRVKLSPSQREKWSRTLYGHANLYGLFTDLAVRITKTNGVVAYVTPASFLGGQYFERLRGVLAEEAPPVAIDFVASREGVFDNVQQETVLVAYRKGPALPFPVSFVRVIETGEATVSGSAIGRLPTDGTSPWLLPRSRAQVSLLAAAKTFGTRLRDLGYEVSTGPLVWNRHKGQLADQPSRTAVPIVWAESVDSRSTGIFTLQSADSKRPGWYRPSSDADPNLVRESCVLVQRTTSLEQSRRLLAAALPEAVFRTHRMVSVENHLNMVRKIPEARVLVKPLVLAALFNTETIDQLFRCINGSTAVSAYELESMPLPDAAALRGLESILARNGTSVDIEAFVHQLYAHVRADAAA